MPKQKQNTVQYVASYCRRDGCVCVQPASPRSERRGGRLLLVGVRTHTTHSHKKVPTGLLLCVHDFFERERENVRISKASKQAMHRHATTNNTRARAAVASSRRCVWQQRTHGTHKASRRANEQVPQFLPSFRQTRRTPANVLLSKTKSRDGPFWRVCRVDCRCAMTNKH